MKVSLPNKMSSIYNKFENTNLMPYIQLFASIQQIFDIFLISNWIIVIQKNHVNAKFWFLHITSLLCTCWMRIFWQLAAMSTGSMEIKRRCGAYSYNTRTIKSTSTKYSLKQNVAPKFSYRPHTQTCRRGVSSTSLSSVCSHGGE